MAAELFIFVLGVFCVLWTLEYVTRNDTLLFKSPVKIQLINQCSVWMSLFDCGATVTCVKGHENTLNLKFFLAGVGSGRKHWTNTAQWMHYGDVMHFCQISVVTWWKVTKQNHSIYLSTMLNRVFQLLLNWTNIIHLLPFGHNNNKGHIWKKQMSSHFCAWILSLIPKLENSRNRTMKNNSRNNLSHSRSSEK